MTLEEIRAAIAEEKAEILRRQAFLVALEALERLHVQAERTKLVPKMPAQAESVQPKRRGRPLTSAHPFPRALEALRPPLTVTAWAKRHRLDREQVKLWFAAEDKGGRPIPREWAERIDRELGIPATLATWKNGIR